MPHFVHVHVVGVAVVAMPVIGHEHKLIGALLFFFDDAHQTRCSLVNIRANKSTVSVVLRPARHATVGIAEPFVARDTKNLARCSKLVTSPRKQFSGCCNIGRPLAVLAVGGGYEHQPMAGRCIFGDGATTNEAFVIGVGVQKKNRGHG